MHRHRLVWVSLLAYVQKRHGSAPILERCDWSVLGAVLPSSSTAIGRLREQCSHLTTPRLVGYGSSAPIFRDRDWLTMGAVLRAGYGKERYKGSRLPIKGFPFFFPLWSTHFFDCNLICCT